MAKRTAFLLIGIPASGKSTYAEKLTKESKNNLRVISTDNARKVLYGDENILGKWPDIQAFIEEELEYAYLHAEDVVIDATHYRRKDRKGMIRTLLKYGFDNIQGVFLDSDLETALNRNRSRERVVPEDVIEKMHKTLAETPPEFEEGFSKLTIVVDN